MLSHGHEKRSGFVGAEISLNLEVLVLQSEIDDPAFGIAE
jgi:hypothetical protein